MCVTSHAGGMTYTNADLAIQYALLHDVLKETPTTYHDIEQQFGAAVAKGVLALLSIAL
jgi:(p)ppGpp synthase/HD superfamily hydrolase